MIFSCVIPASERDKDSQMLKDLIGSIKSQDFDQNEIEILVITEGDSEQAKAEGIRRAKGEIIGMFCADNQIMNVNLFTRVKQCLDKDTAAIYPRRYFYNRDDNSLNRYFSLIGGNDPVCYYLGKNDRDPHVLSLKRTSDYQPSYGCNGFFYHAEAIKATDLDHYYPMDNALEVKGIFRSINFDAIWHRTSDNLFTFLRKRYRYARDLYSDRTDRRWKMVVSTQDYWRLAGFVLATLTVVQCFSVSIRGFLRGRDFAWFWHWPVCLGFLITYGLLTCRNLLKFQSLFQRSTAPRNLADV